MAYPNTIDSYTANTDNVDDVIAADVNELQTAIVAIETELGTLPKGSAADLKTRLAHSINNAGWLEFDAAAALTISAGAVTVTQNYHTVDTESSAASDDLDTINGGTAGLVVVMRTANDARDVTIRHAVGNVYCAGGANIVLDYTYNLALLIYDAALSRWNAFQGQAGSAVTGSGTSGYIVFWGGSSTITGESNLYWDATNNRIGINTASPETPGHIVLSNADTNTLENVLIISKESSGTPAAGFGAGIAFRLETSTTANQGAASINALWKTATHASRVGNMRLNASDSTGGIEIIDLYADTGMVVNETGLAAIDFRVEGDSEENMILVDASADDVFLGGSTAGLKVNKGGATEVLCSTASALTIGNGAAGVDYVIKIDGETSDLNLTYMEDEGYLKTDQEIRAATTLYRRYYHLPMYSADPGAAGAAFTAPGANTAGGWQIDAATEFLYFDSDVHADWDAASDLKVEIVFEVNVNNTGGGTGDTVDLKLQAFYKGDAETACKTQAVAEVATVVGQSAQYKQFTATFTIDYDATDNVVQVGDKFGFILNLETDTSEVDNIIINGGSFYYNTTHIGIEAGDV